MKYKILIFLFLSINITLSNAQISKADKYYAKLEYAQAIPIYEKALKKTVDNKQDALLKLADCYRILNEYQKAEICYKQAIDMGTAPADAIYNYGNVLKSNNKYNEALDQFYYYLNAKPNDARAKNAYKFCLEIKYWQSKPKEYEIKNIEAINTMRSEFCPTVFNNELIYVGEKVTEIVDFEHSTTNNQPFLNVYSSTIKGTTYSKSTSFSKKLNTNFHDGPISFSSDGKTCYITRVNYVVNKRNNDFINRAKIYTSTSDGKKWTKATPFQFNNDNYSCAHPSISNDGTVLYFSSDMPGGLGGHDIWMCKRNGENWDNPVNLGPDINTSGDELFPFIRKDNILYFSSNGLPGFGDLDIYSGKMLGNKWLLNKNEGLFLNSNADDFGIVFTSDTTGYFSSNKEGGKGGDDVYAFIYRVKSVIVDGTILLTENSTDRAKNVKVFLLDAVGKKLDSTRTDDKGYFAFKNLEVDKVYMAEIDENDSQLKLKSRFYLADKNGNISRITHEQGDNQKFVFRNLPITATTLPDLYDDDDLTLAGNLLFGENPSKPVANKKITIKNEYGDVVEETTTNEFGAFAFRNLPVDQNYSIYIDDSDIPFNSKIILTNKKGKELKVTRSGRGGDFKFNLLSVDKTTLNDLAVADDDLIMNIKGYIYDQDKKPITNAKVALIKNNITTDNIQTDEKGRFNFKNLETDKSYIFDIDDNDPRFAMVTKILIADSRGRIYKEVTRNKNGKFVFQLLEIDKTAFGDFTVDDPWLKVLEMKNKQKQEALTITENLYYAYSDFKIDAGGVNVLDKVISILNNNKNLTIELSSHTDSRSSDQYNLALSVKRAKAAVDYIISKGIDKSRLKAIGYGESKLLNKCANDVPCSEEEHAQNRRTEFKIIELGKM